MPELTENPSEHADALRRKAELLDLYEELQALKTTTYDGHPATAENRREVFDLGGFRIDMESSNKNREPGNGNAQVTLKGHEEKNARGVDRSKVTAFLYDVLENALTDVLEQLERRIENEVDA